MWKSGSATLVLVAFAPLSQAGGPIDFHASGFEGTDGGWTADATWDIVGDWERGIPAPGGLNGCSFSVDGPGAAFEGQEVWGTRLSDCYTNADGSSFLRQTFDFTTVIGGELRWRQFRHIIGSSGNDQTIVRINGDIVYQNPLDNFATEGFELQTVDLSPYEGLASVEIVFELFATASINAAGWYIDDVHITSLVDPNPDDLGVIVHDQPDPVTTVGDSIIYQVTAINHSDSPVTGVTLQGMLDSSTAFDAVSSDITVQHDGAPMGGGYVIDVGMMGAFSAQTFVVAAQTTQLGNVSFDANVSGDAVDPNATNDNHVENTLVTLITDLSAALASDQDPAISGTPFTYSLEISNAGPSAAVSPQWRVVLPTDVTFVAASEGLHDGLPSGGQVSGTIGGLPVGGSHTVTIDVIPNVGPLDDLVAEALAIRTDPDASDPDASNNATTLTVGHTATATAFSSPVFTSSAFNFDRPEPLPSSMPPGLPSEAFSFFARPHVSPDGQTWGLHAFLDTNNADQNEVIVIVESDNAYTAVRKGVTPLPDVPGELVGLIRDKMTINDDACYAFYADSDTSQDVIVKGCGVNVAGGGSLIVIARQGNPVPGEPTGLLYSFGSEEPNLANDGTVRFYARTQGAITPDFDKFVVATPDDGATVLKLLQEGVSIPAGQAGGAMDPWDDWRREFSSARNGLYVTGDGMHRLLSGFTDSDSGSNDVLTFDDSVVIQEGEILDPVFTSPVTDPDGGIYLAPNGDWYARGKNADGSQWVVRNGELLARTGDEIFPGADEHWANTGGFPSGFTLIAADGDGNYVIGGTTDGPLPATAGFQLPPLALVYNNDFPILRTGDPVDIDGNGLFDDGAFIGRVDPDGAVLLDGDKLVVSLFASAPLPFLAATAGPTTTSDSPTVVEVELSERTGACCFDGQCSAPMRIQDCIRSGGSYRGDNSQCEGDTDGDGIDDVCRRGACCRTSVGELVCENAHTRGSCADADGTYRGDNAICLGDDNGNGTDDLCESCSNAATATGPGCDDGNFCTTDLCGLDGFCVYEAIICDDDNSCTYDYCDPHLERCVNEPQAGCEVCIYRVNCLDGDCQQCPDLAFEGQECRDEPCPSGTCAGQVITTCGDASCCVELELVDCRAPDGEPACPVFTETCACSSATGACCLADGGCVESIEASCVGTYMGDGSTCDPVQTCCTPDAECTDRAEVCCQNDNLVSFSGSCSDVTGKCCAPDGSCADGITGVCCSSPFFPDQTCTVRACCLGNDCVDMDPACCASLGGFPTDDLSCGEPQACCMGNSCVDEYPACCESMGGVVTGAPACAEEACCFDDGACVNLDPGCCTSLGGTPDGPGLCLAAQACCYDNGDCEETDAECCELAGGTAVDSDTCEAEVACCFPNDECETLSPVCCAEFGGTPATGTLAGGSNSCSGAEGCCTPLGCIEIDPACCELFGFIPTGEDFCDIPEACCFPDGFCVLEDSACCEILGGTPLGPGSECVGDGQPPDGVDNACQQACCMSDDGCVDMLPTVCALQGHEPGGPGSSCLGDENKDGRDDFCQNSPDLNGDGVIDLEDHKVLADCLTGPLVTPDAMCEAADFNGDGVVDQRDVSFFWIAMQEN